MENRSTPQGPEGCLTVAIRIPVRIVVLVLVVPVRMAWDLLAAGAKAVRRVVLVPLWRVLVVIPFEWSYRFLLTPLGQGITWLAGLVGAGCVALGRGVARLAVNLVASPARWLFRTVLAPLGRGVGRVVRGIGTGIGLAAQGIGFVLGRVLWAVFVRTPATLWRLLHPLLRYGLLAPGSWLYRNALTPLGHATAWLGRAVGAALTALARGLGALVVLLFVVPVVWAYRQVLTPLGRALAVVAREIGHAVGHAWRAAGFVSRAVGRGLKWLGRNLVGRPLRWVYAALLTPVGHWARDTVLRPAARAVRGVGRIAADAARGAGHAAREALASARETVRNARQEAWRALVGGSPRERVEHRARTLGSTTTASGAVPAPEISLSKTEG
ncbi:hypothetical protein [Streptomyces sp. NPDC006691]|uniref:hypothetical protein n=1 Tax=Streptomyces sp. NPDC006691 TaxID=3364757 RepID=UPI0036C02D39